MANVKTQNTFKYEPIDCSNKNLWMHSVERMDTNNNGNIIYSFAIAICSLLLMAAMFYAIGEYSKAFPPTKQTSNNKPLNDK